MPIAAEQFRRFFKEAYYQRGLEYFQNGAVVSAEVTGPKRVEAVVVGSGRKSYRQTITLTFSKRGSLIGIQGVCTCPTGYNCKHIAAALLAVADSIEPPKGETADHAGVNGSSPVGPVLSDRLVSWLEQVKAAQTADERSEEELPARIKERIFYVVGTDRQQRTAVTPIKGIMKRNGDVGAGARPYNPGNLDFEQPPQFVTQADLRIFRLIMACGLHARLPGSHGPAPEAEDLRRLLEKVAETGRAHWQTTDGPLLRPAAARPARLEWRERDDGLQSLTFVDEWERPLETLPSEPPFYFDPASGDFGLLQLDMAPRMAAALSVAPPVPPEAANEVAQVLRALKGTRAPLPRTLRIKERRGGRPKPVLRLFTLPAKQQRSPFYEYGALDVAVPAMRVSFDYQGHEAPAFPKSDPQFGEEGQIVRLKRDLPAEEELLATLQESGALAPGSYPYLRFDQATREGDLAFPESDRFEDWVFADAHEDPKSAALTFTAESLPRLRSEGWEVKIESDWPYRVLDGPLTFHAGIEEEASGLEWFSFSLKVEVDGQVLDLLPVILSILKILPLEERGGLPEDFDLETFLEELVLYPELPDGGLVRLEAEQLTPIVHAFLGIHGLGGNFHLAEAGKAAAVAEALENAGIAFAGGERFLELGRKLRHLSGVSEVSPPAGLNANLRPYQAKGYAWLATLGETGFGGCLADDMGLGKTVQALALLVRRHLVEGAERPSLLVVPTSLVGNWQREAERFAPGLRVLVLHGNDRHESFADIPDHQLIITTYPLIHRDHEVLFAYDYDLAILDEAQAVKNPASNAAKRIREINARQRIALTGTPIENNLQELWSLFDWLIPGLLGDRKSFKETFRTPIEKQGDAEVQQRLNSRIRPFLLRRTKEEVASDLPPKTEITELVPLNGAQRSLYETLRTAMDARVRAAIRAKGLNASRITILDALLKLRQACCDPALVKLEHATRVKESAKRQRLMEMLEELVGEKRRILVFSQFVEMLRLIEPEIQARGWDYAMLTGQTKDRTRMVNRFQQGDVPIFLISLKAGGVGLNLTAADTVILYDPWWNPAVERQAMDRAHRIGQDKPVFVYRMVAEGTVESAIQELQARKQALADALFEGSGDSPLGLSEEDIAALFEPLEAAAA